MWSEVQAPSYNFNLWAQEEQNIAKKNYTGAELLEIFR